MSSDISYDREFSHDFRFQHSSNSSRFIQGANTSLKPEEICLSCLLALTECFEKVRITKAKYQLRIGKHCCRKLMNLQGSNDYVRMAVTFTLTLAFSHSCTIAVTLALPQSFSQSLSHIFSHSLSHLYHSLSHSISLWLSFSLSLFYYCSEFERSTF